jgi:hypothetical protein
MRGEPVLQVTTIQDEGDRYPLSLTVNGGLHYIKGNSAPYFSLTCWYHRVGRPRLDEGGGAAHELILRHFPQYADLAALHLSDMDGVPTHAEANGMYWLAGAMGNPFGETYHGGNREYGDSSPAACLQIFADHVRVSIEDAQTIADLVRSQILTLSHNRRQCAHDFLASICADMRPRWKREADACIAAHGLVIFGDEWKGVTA